MFTLARLRRRPQRAASTALAASALALAAATAIAPAAPAAAQEPSRQLRGFAQVDLAPRQSQLVVFRLSRGDLAYFSTARNRFTVAPGRYTVLVSTSSAARQHAASFQVGRLGG